MQPPKQWLNFFRWYCDPLCAEDIEGDLLERFDKRIKHGQSAKWLFIKDVLLLFRPGIIKSFEGTQKLNNYGMLKNYFKISIRNILRHKTFSFLNISGLSVGMTCCVLIMIYVQNELSYDNYHENSANIYRVLQTFRNDAEVEAQPNALAEDYQVWGNAPVGPALQRDFPEVESVFRFTSKRNILFKYKDKRFQERNILYADSTAFDLFSWKMIAGNPKEALREPRSIVLTRSLSEKYFGDSNPIGQTLILDQGDAVQVTGVMEDVPHNSHFTFNALISMSTFHDMRSDIFDAWGYVDFYTYIKMHPNTDMAGLEERIPEFIGNYVTDFPGFEIIFEPLSQAYLYSKAGRQPGPMGSLTNVYVFSSIAVFILLIACINFMNLSTARSVERAKEVAIRKSIGSHRSSIMFQFLCEAIVLTGLAAILAVILVLWTLPMLEVLSGKILPAEWLLSTEYIFFMILAVLFLGILAGAYPAFVLSNFKPMQVLKGSFKTSSKGTMLRKSLVVLQFSISIALLVGTSVVYSQLSHLQDHELGFDSERMLVIDFGWDSKVQNHRDYIKSKFLDHPDVSAVAVSRAVPGDFFPNGGTGIVAASGELEYYGPAMYEIDDDFIPSYEMKMAAGRNYSKEFPLDSINSLIVNRAAIKLYGYSNPEEIIGKSFAQWGREGKVIGVVEDFNYVSLHSRIEPLALRYGTPENTTKISLRLKSNDWRVTVPEIESIWDTVAPHRPFSYYFLDDNFNSHYKEDARFGRVFGIFSGLAIFIACMGLFGLTIYSTAQRTKEIGIRKVLGASAQNILRLLSLDFIKLFLISLFVAVPISWYVMQQWLQGFAYSIELSWPVFLISAVISLIVSLATMSLKTMSAARSNPVDALRNE